MYFYYKLNQRNQLSPEKNIHRPNSLPSEILSRDPDTKAPSSLRYRIWGKVFVIPDDDKRSLSDLSLAFPPEPEFK